MATVSLKTKASIPANSSVSVDIFEDTDGNGNANNQASGTISDGTNIKSFAGFDASIGNQFWVKFTLSNVVDETPTINSAKVFNSTGGVLWSDNNVWDSSASESGAVHTAADYTDFDDPRVVGKGYSPNNPILSSGLVDYFPLQQTVTSVFKNYGSRSFNPTQLVAPTSETGFLGRRNMDFNGSDTYINAGNPVNFDGAYSISLWYRSTTTSANNVLYGCRDSDNSNQVVIDLDIGGDGLEFEVFDGSSKSVTRTNTDINDGNWHHVVAVQDETNTNIEMWFDSASQGTAANGDPDLQDNFSIGRRGGGGGGDFYADADLAELRVYNRALDGTDVQNLYDVVASNTTLTTVKREI